MESLEFKTRSSFKESAWEMMLLVYFLLIYEILTITILWSCAYFI